MEAGMLLMNTVDEPFANDPPPCSEHEQLLPHAIAAGTPLIKTLPDPDVIDPPWPIASPNRAAGVPICASFQNRVMAR
jgi:hypothetical protein